MLVVARRSHDWRHTFPFQRFSSIRVGCHVRRLFSRYKPRKSGKGSSGRKENWPPKPPVPPQSSTAKDPFQWMEDLKDIRTRHYLRRENDYTDSVLKKNAKLLRFQKRIENEILSFELGDTDGELPERSGPYLYYSARSADRGGAVFYRCKAKGEPSSAMDGRDELPPHLQLDPGSEQVLLDENELAREYNTGYAMLGTMRISPNHQYLAYTVDVRGDESYMGRVRSLKPRKHQSIQDEFHLDNALSFAWGSETSSSTSELPCIFYTVANELKRACRVYKVVLGHQTSTPALIFSEDEQEDCFVDLHSTKDSKLITIVSTASR